MMKIDYILYGVLMMTVIQFAIILLRYLYYDFYERYLLIIIFLNFLSADRQGDPIVRV